MLRQLEKKYKNGNPSEYIFLNLLFLLCLLQPITTHHTIKKTYKVYYIDRKRYVSEPKILKTSLQI